MKEWMRKHWMNLAAPVVIGIGAWAFWMALTQVFGPEIPKGGLQIGQRYVVEPELSKTFEALVVDKSADGKMVKLEDGRWLVVRYYDWHALGEMRPVVIQWGTVDIEQSK